VFPDVALELVLSYSVQLAFGILCRRQADWRVKATREALASHSRQRSAIRLRQLHAACSMFLAMPLRQASQGTAIGATPTERWKPFEKCGERGQSCRLPARQPSKRRVGIRGMAWIACFRALTASPRSSPLGDTAAPVLRAERLGWQTSSGCS